MKTKVLSIDLKIKAVHTSFKMESSRSRIKLLNPLAPNIKICLEGFLPDYISQGTGVNPSPHKHVIDIQRKPEAQHRTRGGGEIRTIRRNLKILRKFSLSCQKRIGE